MYSWLMGWVCQTILPLPISHLLKFTIGSFTINTDSPTVNSIEKNKNDCSQSKNTNYTYNMDYTVLLS